MPAGLATVEGAIFGLMGLLLAFTISGALQRFDDRRQLVLQEAAAAATAYDRLGVFEGEAAGQLQHKLKEYVLARVDLYRMPHDFRVWKSAEYFSSAQQQVVASQKRNLWDAAVASCPRNNFQPACSLVLPALEAYSRSRGYVPARARSIRRGSSISCCSVSVWAAPCSRASAWQPPPRELGAHGAFCRDAYLCALYRDRHGISASWSDPHRELRPFPRGYARADALTAIQVAHL